jgi:cell division protein FtsN
MADFDRRTYPPGAEPPLTLGDRPTGQRRTPRARRPTPITLILSVLVLIAAVGVVVWLYRGGARSHGDAPQPVGAPLRDVRVAAPPQSAPADPAAGLSIYKDGAASTTPPAFTSAPETPGPRPTAAPARPAPDAATDASESAQPAVKSASRGDAIGALIDKTERPPAKATPQAPAKPERLAQADTGVEVQIGAFSSRAQADQGWSAAAAAAPGSMAGKGKRVATIDKDGSTLFRTSITGFASRDEAEALCRRLQAAGRSCFVR